MRRLLCIALSLSVVAAWLSGRAAAGEFSAFVKRIPADANVLVMVDADRLMASPMAVERGWKKKVAKDAETRPILLPPKANKLMRAIAMDLQARTENWEIAFVEAEKGVTLKSIAERQQGYVEKINNTETAWLPQGAYGVKVADDLYGFLFPANRQFLSRWLREKSGQAANYLLIAAGELKSTGPQVMIAVDLEDLVEPGGLGDRLQDFQSLGSTKVNKQEVTRVLEGLRGLKLTVSFAKGATAKLTIDFIRDAAPLKDVAKALIIEAMDNNGLALDEVADWKATVAGKQVTLEGPLGESGLLRLSSLLELPATLIQDKEEQTDAENPELYATQAHYKAVQAILDDLFGKHPQSFGQYAQWAQRYAQKIDRLPLLNVDGDMQAYSARVAELLRGGAESFKGVGIRAAGRQKQVWNTSYVTYGYYGWRNYNASDQEKRAIRGEEKARGATEAADMRHQIDEETAAIRKKMVEKFKVEF